MEYLEHRITLDMGNAVSCVALGAKKGDSARRLRIHLAHSGYPYHIADGCTAVFSAEKPDGKHLLNDCTIDGCEIIYTFTDQTVTAAGLLKCEIILISSDLKQITSPEFAIIVEDTIYDEGADTESTDEYNALAALIETVRNLHDGDSFTAAVREASDGYELILTNVSGKDGTTDEKTIHIKHGSPGERGPQGNPGPAGPPGPAYELTDADRDEIVTAVIDGLPNAPVGGGAYRVTLTVVEHIEGEDDFYVCASDKSMSEITAALESGMCISAVFPFQLDDDNVLPIDIPYKTMADEDGMIMVFSGSLSLERDSLFISALVMDVDGTAFAQVYVTEAGGSVGADEIDAMIDAKLASIPQAEGVSF